MDIIRIAIRPREQRSQGRREGKSSTVLALDQSHESFGAIKSFRIDRREGKAVRLTNQRRQVGILGINQVVLSNKGGGCTQGARATHWEQAGLKRYRDLLLTVTIVDPCKDQGSGTSGFMGGFEAGSRMLVCMHLSVWEATPYPSAQTEGKRWILLKKLKFGGTFGSGTAAWRASGPLLAHMQKPWCAQPSVQQAATRSGKITAHPLSSSPSPSFLIFLTILTKNQAPAAPQLLSYHQTSMRSPTGPEFRAISVVVITLSIACRECTSAGRSALLLEWRNLLPKPGLLIL